VPGPQPAPDGGYKDSAGRMKRQAVRFRIFGLNADGDVVRELTAADADITWTVHLANKKASWYTFEMAFDLPEAKVILDGEGRPREIVRRPRNDAHRLIEEFMLAANEAVARFFDARGLPTVYRVHDVPDAEKLDAFAQLARTHGFELPEGDHLTPQQLNEFLRQVDGKPQQKALNSLLLRAMMQAQYSPDNIGHYGLAAPTYLHFTSPIRRYPDLMVHRLLKEHWARGGRPMREGERKEQEEYLKGVAAQCSERERAAMKAERDVDAFFAALFMIDKVGEEYDAVVGGQPLWHDGRWGMATLEVCLAMMESASQRQEVRLHHQVPVPRGYDGDFQVPGYAD